ncbi:hypothetical protein KEM09_12460 [Carboxylicivirga mesophila]|uniref:DNA-directed DNA polymerase family A palm domain-containing protein n=1 Tax=Carboxylicivirga mesophila TaxID=1166478 RepID=A0ABS5KBF1_9BACT|nr:hypothetical protein [Carboxylicivirga mesophila]MBS2212222.1 hypothetical protein [Carboxylicivirga mesophila]
MQYYIPKSLNDLPDRLIKEIVSGEKLVMHHMEKIWHVIDKLYLETLYRRNHEHGELIRLHSKVCESLYQSRAWGKIRKALVKLNIIEVGDSYQPNIHSKGYQLKEIYLNDSFAIIDLPESYFNKKLIKKDDWNNTYKRCYSNLSKRITIDYKSAIKHIIQKLSFSNNEIEKKVWMLYKRLVLCSSPKLNEAAYCIDNELINDGMVSLDNLFLNYRVEHSNKYSCPIKKPQRYTYHKFKFDLLSILKITNKQFFFSVDSNSGRIYHNISNIRRELKQFIQIDGVNMVGLDIRNSQPLLFGLLLVKKWRKRKATSYEIMPDLKEYLQRCCDGNFYNHLMELNDIPLEQRAEYKVQFFTDVFFSKNPKMVKGALKQFEEIYPNVYQEIRKYKEQDYKLLAHDLQKFEADVIINGIIKSLFKQNKEIPIVNVHDAIYTAPDFAPIVENEIYNYFMNEFGVTPTLNRE